MFIDNVESKGKTIHKLQTGNYLLKEDALKDAKQIQKLLKVKTWIVKNELNNE